LFGKVTKGLYVLTETLEIKPEEEECKTNVLVDVPKLRFEFIKV